MKDNKWELKVHEGHPIADTGDYSDPVYELTNGVVSIHTTDDEVDSEEPDSAIQILLNALNQLSTVKWENWDLDNAKYGYELEKKETSRLYKELEKWKYTAQILNDALEAETNHIETCNLLGGTEEAMGNYSKMKSNDNNNR